MDIESARATSRRSTFLRTLIVLSSWSFGLLAFALGVAAELTQETMEESAADQSREPLGPAPTLGIIATIASCLSILIPTVCVFVFGHKLYRAVTTKSVLVLVVSWLAAAVAVLLLLISAVRDSQQDKVTPQGEQIDINAPRGMFAIGGVLSLVSACLAAAFQMMSFKGEDEI